MRRTLLLLPALVAVFCCLLFSSCGQNDSDVLATLGDGEITLGDFLLAHNAITVFNRPPLLTFEDRERFLKTLINKELLLGEAIKRGLDEHADVVEAQERWEREYSLRAFHKEIVDADLEISLDDVRAHYVKSRGRIRGRHILVASAEAAQDIRSKLLDGEDFSTLAREYSTDEKTARGGGDLGFMEKGVANPVLIQISQQLEIGEISQVLQSQAGFHLMEVTHIQEPNMDNFESERHLASSELRANLRAQRWRDYLQEQLASQNVEFDQDILTLVNDQLPERGTPSTVWHEGFGEEEKAKVIVTHDTGSWTVNDFIEKYPEAGQRSGMAKSPAGTLIKRMLEGDVLNKSNMLEAKKRGLHQLDQVTRDVQKKVQEEMLNILHTELAVAEAVSEEAIQARYDELKADLITPETVEFRMISLQSLPRLEAAYKRFQAGEDFEALAFDVNVGPMKETGGFYGPAARDGIQIPEMQYALFEKLKVGETSGIISPPGRGHLLVRLLKKTSEHPMTLDEARDQIATVLTSEGENERLNDWLSAKRDEAKVKIYPEVLNKLSEGEEPETS